MVFDMCQDCKTGDRKDSISKTVCINCFLLANDPELLKIDILSDAS